MSTIKRIYFLVCSFGICALSPSKCVFCFSQIKITYIALVPENEITYAELESNEKLFLTTKIYKYTNHHQLQEYIEGAAFAF